MRVHVSVSDRILVHLWEQDHQADHYLVTFEMTRPGIAEVCALHLPNVSRTMKELISEGLVSEHTRAVRGEERRQKTWQLTDEGRKNARIRIEKLRSMKVLIRDKKGKLLEIRADEASKKLQTELTLLQVLMHAQHEGVLNFGDIRFGAIIRSEETNSPGSISLLSGAHSTYHNRPPETREVHGRSSEKETINRWYKSKIPMFVLSGIAGCGKTTLVSFWMKNLFASNEEIEAMYYPCQPWDTSLGIATSLLHRLGVGSDDISSDPYGILESLPLKPGAIFNIDLFRRRLTAHLLDEKKLLSNKFSELLVILDDVHNIGTDGANFFGSLLQVSESTQMRLLLISRTNLAFYDRRDVHTRGKVEELILSGLNLEEIKEWIDELEISNDAPIEEIFTVTGGHPLALELLEIYGNTLHQDWLRFLDEEILDVLPKDHRELLAFLAVSDTPVPWEILAKASKFNGNPPKDLIERGLMLELEEGMWLHEALRSRLLREVGTPLDERAKKLGLN
ncbi:MAG: hypothetical protein CMA98_01015 [Euryarchaeota archaeon]|nr:hypothetical protein [Euryarchaeota archaeon]